MKVKGRPNLKPKATPVNKPVGNRPKVGQNNPNQGRTTSGRSDAKPANKGKGKNASKNKGKNNPRYGAVGQYPGTPRNQASQLVNGEIRAGMDDLRSEERKLRRSTVVDRERANAQYQRAMGDLDYVFGETADYQKARNAEVQGIYGQATDRASQAQSALLGMLRDSNTGVNASMGGELDRLGLGAAATGQLQSDQSYGMQVANQTGANNQANLGFSASAAGALGSLLSGMNEGSRISQQGIQRNAYNDRLFEIESNYTEGREEVRDAMADLQGQRGDLTRQMLQQLDDTNWSKWLALEQLGDSRKLNPKLSRGNNKGENNSNKRRPVGNNKKSSGRPKAPSNKSVKMTPELLNLVLGNK